MTNIIKKYWISIVGTILGAIGGYLYYHFVGCVHGTCPITSNPYISVLWGAVIGYLVFDLFKKKTPKNDNTTIEK